MASYVNGALVTQHGVPLGGSLAIVGPFTQSGGAISMTGNAASTITTTAGSMTINASNVQVNIGPNANQVMLGNSGIASFALGGFRVQQDLTLTAATSPAAFGVNQADFAIALAVMRLRCDVSVASVNLSGITAGITGRTVIIHNISATNSLVLTHDDVASTAANRFFLPNNASVTLRPNASATVCYDALSSRWRLIGAAP